MNTHMYLVGQSAAGRRIIWFVLLLFAAFCASVGAQGEGGSGYTTPSRASERFKTWRGAERLPTVDLSITPGAEKPPFGFEQLTDWARVRGGLGYQMDFSNNIFLLGGGAVPGRKSRPSDVFYTISPNVHLEIPALIAPIMFDYSVDVLRAGSFHEFETEEHHFSGRTDLKIGHGFGVRIRDDLDRLSSPPQYPSRRTRMYYSRSLGAPTAYDPTTQTSHLLNNFWNNTSEITGYYKSPDKLRIEGRFVHELARFDARRNWGSDYDIDTAGGEISYKISPRTSLLSEYYHEWVDNGGPLTPDNQRDRVGGGLEWDISAKFSGRFLLGYETFHIVGTTNGYGAYGHAELLYDYSDRLRFGLYFDRRLHESTAIAGNLIDGGTFESDAISLDTVYRLTPKVNAVGELFTVMDGYPFVQGRPGARTQNNLVGASIGLNWLPRDWLRFEAKYRYQMNMSSIPWYRYDESHFILNGVFSF